jgi:hypothetical protein
MSKCRAGPSQEEPARQVPGTQVDGLEAGVIWVGRESKEAAGLRASAGHRSWMPGGTPGLSNREEELACGQALD